MRKRQFLFIKRNIPLYVSPVLMVDKAITVAENNTDNLYSARISSVSPCSSSVLQRKEIGFTFKFFHFKSEVVIFLTSAYS